MNIRRLVVAISVGYMILGAFGQGECADWKLFYMVSEGPKYYYDKESVVHSQKDVIQVWFKVDDPDDAELYRVHAEINCKSKSHRILEESTPSNVNTEEKAKEPSASQSHQRFPLESAFGSLWSNVCPGR